MVAANVGRVNKLGSVSQTAAQITNMTANELTLEGAFTALVTPFTADGEVDYAKLEELVERQIEAGMDGIVPVGTTGESPTLTDEEAKTVIQTVINKANKRCKVVAGTGSNNTAKTVKMTEFAKEAGADAVLIVNPYYSKPTQEGLYRHIEAIAKVDIPIMLYNIPGRSAVSMTPATIARCAKLPQVVAVKEATGSIDQASEIAMLAPDLTILSGDDSLTLPLASVGGRGVVSVVGNLVPSRVKALADACNSGNFTKARDHHRFLFKLCRSMFLETNPIPIKTALELVGFGPAHFRLPLCHLDEAHLPTLKQTLTDAQLL